MEGTVKVTNFKNKLMSKYTREKLEPIVKESFSYADVFRKFNGVKKVHGGSIGWLKTMINRLNIDTSHFDPHKHREGKPSSNGMALTKDEFIKKYLKKNSVIKGNKLKKRIIKFKLIEYKCEKCNNTGEWGGKELVLQLDHKDGVSSNHELSNLRFLCPNCHSQTDSYAGKNGRKN